MSDTIPETVARVLDLDAKATPGPWEDRADQDCDGYSYLQRADGEFSADPVGTSYAHADAALIAYYRTAAPALAREVERLNAAAAGELEHWLGIASKLEAAAATARAECERLRGLLEQVVSSLTDDWHGDADDGWLCPGCGMDRSLSPDHEPVGCCDTCINDLITSLRAALAEVPQ